MSVGQVGPARSGIESSVARKEEQQLVYEAVACAIDD